MNLRTRLGAILASTLLFIHTAHAAQLHPPNGADNICTDTLLGLKYNCLVKSGTSGTIKIIRVADGKIADLINLAASGQTNLYGTKVLRYEPIRIADNSASIQLHSRCLEPKTTYSVTIEPGVFLGPDGPLTGVAQGQWQFTTREALPRGRTRIEVAENSKGDFCTLQGAVDHVPEDNFNATQIFIRNGTYHGITYLGPGRNRITLTGEDRQKTILAGRNNDRMNPGRMMRPFLSVDADDVTIENLTIRNATPYRGSQAEALRIDGQRCTIRACDFYSFQDTLLLGGRVYVADCYIEGDVDFIWGHGVTFFDRCELKAMHDGYYVTSRNPEDLFGFVFNECRLTAAPEVKRCWLARIDTGRFPFSAVAFINCRMGPHIPAEGWQVSGTDVSRLRFYEFQTATLEGKPLDLSQRHQASRQISAETARELADPNRVLKLPDTWQPRR